MPLRGWLCLWSVAHDGSPKRDCDFLCRMLCPALNCRCPLDQSVRSCVSANATGHGSQDLVDRINSLDFGKRRDLMVSIGEEARRIATTYDQNAEAENITGSLAAAAVALSNCCESLGMGVGG